MSWKPIETLTPKMYERYIVWAPGWRPQFLMWKDNQRIKGNPEFLPLYFGDPEEWDDYDLARPGNGPTKWFDLPSPEDSDSKQPLT